MLLDNEGNRNGLDLCRPTSLGHRRDLTINLDENVSSENNAFHHLSTGTLKFPDDPTPYTFQSCDLIDHGTIGCGNFGQVSKMQHNRTKKLLAVKRIRCTNVDEREKTRLLREHDTIMKSEKGPNIVKFFGAIFSEGDCWICMELMDVSLNHLYKRVYREKRQRLSENVIGHVAVSTVDALDYLKKDLKIIHRDVKPSNILVNKNGDVKLCDFGICGQLEDSVVKTHDAGCQPYLAPERITSHSNYDVRADVWSLGITLYEISTGKFPYNTWTTMFEQIAAVVDGDAPMLTPNGGPLEFSPSLVTFINSCLTKERKFRPKYDTLKKFEFYLKYTGGSDIQKAKEILGREAIDARDHPVEIRG
ncbi:unnamed protein product [Caenorhabditis bovis]|uniref:mitogen-activated protein kinase kinase n=1 Tax=Caenorhabditis bovis TaxID=2654633 RepID=A0A8S1F357_9PELO|nr:unnamed protein product [Caenorhabditis bovis]